MNTIIEIHESNTPQSGQYKVWYKLNGAKMVRFMSENCVNSLLDMRQKESFFMGKFRFKIKEYDFIHLVVNGEVRQ